MQTMTMECPDNVVAFNSRDPYTAMRLQLARHEAGVELIQSLPYLDRRHTLLSFAMAAGLDAEMCAAGRGRGIVFGVNWELRMWGQAAGRLIRLKGVHGLAAEERQLVCEWLAPQTDSHFEVY